MIHSGQEVMVETNIEDVVKPGVVLEVAGEKVRVQFADGSEDVVDAQKVAARDRRATS